MPETTSALPFVDLEAQRRRLGNGLIDAIAAVIEHGQFIMGPDVFELERQLVDFSGAAEVVTCASGTDALLLALLAQEIGPGDAVYVPSFTFAATAEMIPLVGATPVFVDVLPDTFNLDPASLKEALGASAGLRPRAVIPVDLFGLPADYAEIVEIATAHDLVVIADAAQSFGATLGERAVGTLAPVSTTSFFPAKPLGCYGDGGAIFTNDPDIAARLRSLRVHGQGSHKYENVLLGINGRLDTIQAAVLLEKLRIFPDELLARAKVAERYTRVLSQRIQTPTVPEGVTSAWAQYTVRVPRRDHVAVALREAGVPTAVYYPVPLHRQPAYRSFPTAPGELAVSERLATEVLSLPMHPYLDEPTHERICNAVLGAAT
ncbi:MAG: DegT/DnrJ/EryC1/StrS family aminotransferase [Actinomycetota bacterium]|nr:DegT/DnrJ/EryC1/StrS family aminotransferase [Actinomycetota bacterium]